jgi:hypothetical protein
MLRVPTIAVPVQLALVGRAAAVAELFVADVPRQGRSQLLDAVATMLDDPQTFVPLRGDREIVLLAKHAVAWIAIARDESLAEAEEVTTLYDRRHRVSITLAGGGEIAGTFLDSSPADRPRVVDHLNRAGRFVRVWTSDHLYLVNTLQIVEVCELPNEL